MVETMVAEMNQKHGRRVSRRFGVNARTAEAHNWPGNGRELRNTIERAVILCPDDTELEAEHLPQWFARSRRWKRPPDGSHDHGPRSATVDEAERLLILRTLEVTGQNKTAPRKFWA